jgi:hypothetical protein
MTISWRAQVQADLRSHGAADHIMRSRREAERFGAILAHSGTRPLSNRSLVRVILLEIDPVGHDHEQAHDYGHE